MTLEALELLTEAPLLNDAVSSAQGSLGELGRGVGHLWAFVRDNFAGPVPPPPSATSDAAAQLSIGENRLHPKTRRPEQLLQAKNILLGNAELAEAIPLSNWWAARTLRIWQAVLREPEISLKVQLDELRPKLQELLPSLPTELQFLLRLEIALGHAAYFEIAEAQSVFDAALKDANFRLEVGGALGKRTRFQVKEVAQLLVRGHRETGRILSLPGATASVAFVTDVALSDDTLLEAVALSEPCPSSGLSGLEQAAVITRLRLDLRGRSEALDLEREETRAFAQLVLEEPMDRGLHVAALVFRSQSEVGERRRAERALAQSEALSTAALAATPPFADRVSPLLWVAQPEPVWTLQKLHANILLSLGITRESLVIYEQLEEWDKVIECYKLLEKPEQAESVVRARLAEGETAELFCILGDLTMNIAHYEKAWELSNGRSARAQRSLGDTWLIRTQYATALGHFEESLRVQPLHLGAWYSLGFCGMELKRYDDAARAYRRCVAIDPDNGTAWNNLAAAHIHLGNIDKAFLILQDALRFNYENWKVWENFAGVAAKAEEWAEVMRASHRLLDLKDKYCDEAVLELLVPAAVDSEALLPKARELLARMAASGCLRTPRALQLRALLLRPSGESATAEAVKGFVTAARQAHQAALEAGAWEKGGAGAVDLLAWAALLAEAQLSLASRFPGPCAQEKASAKLMLRSLIARVTKRFPDSRESDLEEALTHTQTLLDQCSA